jgi:predicted GH43/DUF377 family glycosyl hydrolase
MSRDPSVTIGPDPSRVVIRPFQSPGQGRDLSEQQRARLRRVVDHVGRLSDAEAGTELEMVAVDFATRHWEITYIFEERGRQILQALGETGVRHPVKIELIGAFFCLEYAYCAAAVTNPSIVPHPDQSGLGEGDTRFVLSLRNVGEGHISSISFREGIVACDGTLHLWPQTGPTIAAIPEERREDGAIVVRRPASVPISAGVIFPVTEQQKNGLEDLRLVAFQDDDGATAYHGTYTAYSGGAIRSEILSTPDFGVFTLSPVTGSAAPAKGLALFPRKIDGKYAAIGRHDGETMTYVTSTSLTHWDEGEPLAKPEFIWELMQQGNCGSPIELDEGFLLLTHGVGAMRKYAIGAMLLDKKDPRKVLGRSREPLIAPTPDIRNGYVPNVVYTCGALRCERRLLVPYGVADQTVGFAMFELAEILAAL